MTIPVESLREIGGNRGRKSGKSGTEGTFSDICLTRLVWLIMIGDFQRRETYRLSPRFPRFVPPVRYYNTGTWGFDLLPLGVAHEFGHLLGLWDVSVLGKPMFGSRNPNDIMNSKSEVTPYDIESIIGLLNKFRCRCN